MDLYAYAKTCSTGYMPPTNGGMFRQGVRKCGPTFVTGVYNDVVVAADHG